MLFAIGTKVRLKHTGDEGVITATLGGGMLNVYVAAENMEIPVFEEDLVRADAYENPHHKAKLITTLTKKEPEQKIIQYLTSSNNVAASIPAELQGIYIAFEPQYNNQEIISHYHVFLINATQDDYIFSVRQSYVTKTIHGKLTSTTIHQLEKLLFDQLNDNPVLDIEYWKITTKGTGNKQQKTLKIKAKSFFKNVKTAPLLNRSAHVYLIFNQTVKKAIQKEDDLKTYTQKKVRPVKYQTPQQKTYTIHDVKECAHFSGEIDLHIENLPSRKGKMNNAEKLHLQLEHFDRFMEKAIRLGVPRVFIIHGIGKGKLRNLIASRLIQMPEVKTFKNEYHPRYGWGATEVIF